MDDFDLQLYTLSAAVTAAHKEGYQIAVLAIHPKQLEFNYKFEGFDSETQRFLIQLFKELAHKETGADEHPITVSHNTSTDSKDIDLIPDVKENVCRDGFCRQTRLESCSEDKLNVLLQISGLVNRNIQSKTTPNSTANNCILSKEDNSQLRPDVNQPLLLTNITPVSTTIELDTSSYWDSEAESTRNGDTIQQTSQAVDESCVIIKVEPDNESVAVYGTDDTEDLQANDLNLQVTQLDYVTEPEDYYQSTEEITHANNTNNGPTGQGQAHKPIIYPFPELNDSLGGQTRNSFDQCCSQPLYGYIAQQTRARQCNTSRGASPGVCQHNSTVTQQFNSQYLTDTRPQPQEGINGLVPSQTISTHPSSPSIAMQKRAKSPSDCKNLDPLTQTQHHQCPYCPHTATWRAELNSHIRQNHIVKNNGVNKCPHCKYKTMRISDLKRHLRNVHNNPVEKRHQCVLCDYTAGSEDVLRVHIINTHKKNAAQVCPQCSYTTWRTGDLRRHIRIVHKKEEWKPLKTYDVL